jgi:hypothetical protein
MNKISYILRHSKEDQVMELGTVTCMIKIKNSHNVLVLTLMWHHVFW